MKKIQMLIVAFAAMFLVACGGGSDTSNDGDSGSETNNSVTFCAFTQVGLLSDDNATGNIKCTDTDGIRNTDNFPAVVTVNGNLYELEFTDNSMSFDVNVTVTGLVPDTNTTASLDMYVVDGENGEINTFSLEGELETNSIILIDQPTTITAPTLDSKSDTKIYTKVGTFSDSDGIQNVTVALYSDSTLTNLLQTNTSGDFLGLTASTTYYVVTSGEALNTDIGIWEAKKSTALVVTTNATPPPANTAPTATDATADTAGGETVTYDLVGHIADNETADSGLTITVLSGPTKGTLSWSGTEFTFTATPASGVFGEDTFTYEVKDPGELTSTATVTIINISEDGNNDIQDRDPDPFDFVDRTGLQRSTAYDTNTISVTGMNSNALITTTAGTLYINGVAVSTQYPTVDSGDTVFVRLTTSDSYESDVTATVRIGGKSDSFTFTTLSE